MPALPSNLTLRNGRIVLRDWQETDAPVLEGACGDWDICMFTSVPWTYTLAEATSWVHRTRRNRSAGTVLSLAITEANDTAVAGNVNLARFSDNGREAALGYWLVPAARRRGLASSAARMLAGWAFQELGIERLELAILPQNARSQRVAERLGAKAEGIRENSHEAGGRRWDMAIYALYTHPGVYR